MPHTPAQVNGAGMAGMNAGMPMNAGHQMDLHHLYDMVLELSDVLKNNREMTNSIVATAEEMSVRLRHFPEVFRFVCSRLMVDRSVARLRELLQVFSR